MTSSRSHASLLTDSSIASNLGLWSCLHQWRPDIAPCLCFWHPGTYCPIKCLFTHTGPTRLLHSPSLVTVQLSVGYETWHTIGWHHPFVNGWFRYRSGLHQSQWNVDSHDRREFPPCFRGHWNSFCTAPLYSSKSSRYGCAPILWMILRAQIH